MVLTGCVVVVILAMPNLLTGTFGFERSQTFEMQSAAIVMQMVGCILAGYFADRFGCGKVMMVGALAVALTAAVFITVWGTRHIQPFWFIYAVGSMLRYCRHGVEQYGQNVPRACAFLGYFIFL